MEQFRKDRQTNGMYIYIHVDLYTFLLMFYHHYTVFSLKYRTLIVRTPKFFHVLIAPDMEISRDFPISNYNRTVLRVRVCVRTMSCRVPRAKLLSVFVLPSAPTQSCQGTDEKSTSRVRGGIHLPSLQRRRDRDGQLALGLPAGKATYEAGIEVPDSAEVLLFSF